MARSLTVQHTEEPGTSSLLNAFLLLALVWLTLGMLVAGFTADAQTPPADVTPINDL